METLEDFSDFQGCINDLLLLNDTIDVTIDVKMKKKLHNKKRRKNAKERKLFYKRLINLINNDMKLVLRKFVRTERFA